MIYYIYTMLKFKPINDEQLFLLPPSVQDFIPSNHLSRIISEVVDSIDTSVIEEKYSHLGQKSYSPKLLLKLMFYGYSIGIRSGRKIAMACESDTAFMFLANMYRPDFRTINDFRKDNIAFVQTSFVHIVRLCKELGMCKLGSLTIDGTKLKANANSDHSKTKNQYSNWLQSIHTDIESLLKEAERIDQHEDKLYGKKRGDEIPVELANKQKLRSKIQEALKKFKTTNEKERVNLNDTDAKFIKGAGRIDTNYNCQAAISEDGIIVSAYSNNNASDRTETIRVVESAEANTKENVTDILADRGYASYDNYEYLENKGKNCFIPDQQLNTESDKEQNPYHRNHFKYVAENNQFICPENKIVKYSHQSRQKKTKQEVSVYQCYDCPACDKQNLCTKGMYRQINIERREHLRTKIRERLKSVEGKIKYVLRMRIESIFGNLKHNLNYKHLYLKGIKKTTAEWQLICIGHNLKKIHQFKMR
jgi:transposase